MVHRCLLPLLLLSACEAPHALRFFVNAREVQEHDAGLVTLTQPQALTFTIENHSRNAVTLRERHVRGEGSAEAFALLSDACGRSLAPGERCNVQLSFDPLSESQHRASLVVRYEDDEHEREIALPLSGRGKLDCAVSHALTTAKQEGTIAAQNENAANAAQGDAAGRALTYDQGYDDSYSGAYQQGYNAGYASGAYDDAYRASYSEGVYAGQSDPNACSDGSTAGDLDGYADGVSAGRGDGYAAGENDGYDAGYARGERDAAQDCTPTRDVEPTLRSALRADDPTLVSACFDRGHKQTLNQSAYGTAYRAAAALNPAYQTGRTDGFNAGYSLGATDGDAQAYANGDARGYEDGFRAGANERFADCYDATYSGGFNDGYAVGYSSSSYDTGFEAGSEDGYDAGYDAVYDELCG